MVVQVTVPDMGESIIEATVARWIKQEGESVRAGEPVVELETDKVNLEVGASQAGVLQRIEKQTGETVNVGDVLAWVAPVGESGEESSPATETKPAAPQPAESAATHQEGGKQDAPGEDTEAVIKREVEQDAEAEKGLSDERITPLARRMAEDLGVDLSQVTPTGAGGRITKEDVKSYLERPTQRTQPPDTQPVREQPRPTPQPSVATQARPAQPAVPSTDGRPEERIRMTRRRQTIARRLVEAQQTAAMLTTFNEVDMSAVIDLRKRRRENFKEKFGVDLGFMPFFIKASIGALKAFPYLNAEIQNEEIVLKQYYDIGIAVGAEEGLVVPVIRNADRMSFAEIERTIREFINRSREGTLTLEDLRGGTFTITNGGVFGSLLSTPILNPPQVGILGMHRIQERPVVINGEIVIRPMMYIALSYDHRIVDGRVAVQFLVRLKELVEDPEALLLG